MSRDCTPRASKHWSTPQPASSNSWPVCNNSSLACLEASGGWERQLVEALHRHGLPVVIVNPRQIRDFARAKGQLAKTDQIDAKIIKDYAELLKPKTTAPLTENQQKLRDLTTRARQVTKLLIQEKNRLATTIDKDIQQWIRQAIRLYEKQLQTVRAAQQKLIEQDEQTQATAKIIASVPGLTRNALYMPTVVAKQYNSKIKTFYDRLLKNGKPKMVALIASMRKLLTMLNTMIRNGKTWNEQPQIT